MTEFETLFLANYEELSLHECGKEICKPDKLVIFDRKPYHMFHYISHGSGTFIYENKVYKLKKGDLFYIEADDTVTYFPNPKDPWHYTWIGFKGDRTDNYLKRIGINKEDPIYTDDKHFELNKLFNELYDSYQKYKILNIDMLSILLKIIHKMANNKKVSELKLTAKETHIRNAKQYIENNYKYRIKITDIAKSLGLSPNYLANIFKEELNMSTKSYLINYRMHIASELLTKTNKAINEIADSVGYDNPLHFSAEFKRIKLVSPTLYRKQNKEQ